MKLFSYLTSFITCLPPCPVVYQFDQQFEVFMYIVYWILNIVNLRQNGDTCQLYLYSIILIPQLSIFLNLHLYSSSSKHNLYNDAMKIIVERLGWLKMRKFLKSVAPYVDWYSFCSEKLWQNVFWKNNLFLGVPHGLWNLPQQLYGTICVY